MFCNIKCCKNHFEIEYLKNKRKGDPWSRNWTESTVVGGRGGEPNRRFGHRNKPRGIGGVWPYWEGILDGLAMVTLRRVGEAGSLLSMATRFLLVWATLGRGTGAKAKAAEGNDEGRIPPIDKPAAQFGSFIHLGYSFGGMSTQRRRRGTTRVGFHP